MKPSQVLNRIRIRFGKGCPLGISPSSNVFNIRKVESPKCLDLDPIVLKRFSVEELMRNRITILHSSKDFNWRTRWNFEDKTALWNFNLHYFEYLFPLIKAWQDTGEKQYLAKSIEMIDGWIETNSVGTKPAWSSYTIALRIVVWISYYGYVSEDLPVEFKAKFLQSLHSQYIYLSSHLEKDILGNHYFEDLKSLVLSALFFNDEKVLSKVLVDFKDECKEEILSDGMHFELSPMYHKIVFEGVLRVAIALEKVGKKDNTIESYLQPMLDVSYSFEEGIDRVPLFNDGGNNVAKSLSSLCFVAKEYFNLIPRFKGKLEKSGFYIFKKYINGQVWKLIVDAGQPGPEYNSGHSHCDAMSYELFCDGKPVVVNCGTYAYQCQERTFFRSTSAHNTVMVDGIEQSQCWGAFRLAKRSRVIVRQLTDSSIFMEMRDQEGHIIHRYISFNDNDITIVDKTKSKSILSFVHILEGVSLNVLNGSCVSYQEPYSEDYGKKEVITAYEIKSKKELVYQITPGDKTVVKNATMLKDEYKGFKPIVFLEDRLYFFSKGKLWTVKNGDLKKVVSIIGETWKDKNRLLIRLFRRELKYAIPIDNHRMLAVGFRKLFLIDVATKEVKLIFESRVGFSDPLNICKAGKEWVAIWGDYGSNKERVSVNIYGLKDDLRVETIFSFKPGQIRHIHNIIPSYCGGYYIFTGDQEDFSGIYCADINFENVRPLKVGKQQYRAVVGFDTAQGLLYATDAVNEKNYIYLIKKDEIIKICELNGSCIYGIEYNGSYYFATTVEPDENNQGIISWLSRKRGAGILSDEVTLVKVGANMKTTIVAKYKKDLWPMKLLQYGSIQFPNGKNSELWIYPVAVKGVDGRAIRVHEIKKDS